MLKILKVPNEILLKVCDAVKFPLSKEEQSLFLQMRQMVKNDKNSAGLAAPQVGFLKRMAVVTDKKRVPKILINPKITFASPKKVMMAEGCLSIPNELYEVERSFNIKIEYQDLKGRKILETLTGWEARVVQHEIDHLDGVLINKSGQKIEQKD